MLDRNLARVPPWLAYTAWGWFFFGTAAALAFRHVATLVLLLLWFIVVPFAIEVFEELEENRAYHNPSQSRNRHRVTGASGRS